MKNNILPLLIILLPIFLVGVFLWFLYGNLSQEPGDYLTAALVAKKTVSLKVDLGQDNVDTKKVLERSEINISDPDGNAQENIFDIDLVSADNGEYELKINPKKPTLRPGHYYVSARFVTDQGVKDYTQDFYWGVLALDFDRSVYKPGETAYMQMGVLDDLGNNLCRAELELKIIDPKGQEKILTTADNSIVQNKMCRSNNVMDEPDYYARHLLYYEGIYKFILTAKTQNGTRSIEDYIEVKRDIPFEVQRKGPIRIFPVANYEIEFNIKPNKNFKGEIIERVPVSFGIEASEDFSVRENGDVKEIVWEADWQKGNNYNLKYTFDAPNISPEFYLLGPMSVGSWQEQRFWQIASDQIEYLRPTSYTDSASQTTSETNAYNTNDPPPDTASYSTTITDADAFPPSYSINFHTWASDTQTYTTLYVKVHVATAGIGNDKFGVQYTYDGTNWVDIIAIGNGDISPAATYSSADLVSTYSVSHTTNIAVRITSDVVGPLDGDSVLMYDIWTEGDYTITNNPPTISKVEDGPDPVNAGGAVTFSVVWADQDAEGVKLFICKSNDATIAGCGGGGTWCSDSDTYDTTTPLSCNYTTSSSDVGAKTYYAYVCDDEDCVASPSQGSFTVNAATPMSMRFDGKMQFLFGGYIGVLCDAVMAPFFGTSDLFNGSISGFPGGDQANGGGDDYNNSGSAPADRYEATWTACDAGNSYCGTSLATADAKDENTGLVWSLPCNGVGCTSFSDSTPLTYTWDNTGGNNNSQTASQLCSAGSHGESGWSLPHQKQLMQAYIDGSYGNLETAGVDRYYWSATTYSAVTSFAWYTNLSHGFTTSIAKTNPNYIRCVRLAP